MQCTSKRNKKFQFLTLAAPVLLGMMLKLAALPPLQSLAEGPSTVFWVAARIHIHHVKIRNTEQNFTLNLLAKLTSDGMNGGHQTLNNAKFVIDDLQQK
jgi:hypothetical protein